MGQRFQSINFPLPGSNPAQVGALELSVVGPTDIGNFNFVSADTTNNDVGVQLPLAANGQTWTILKTSANNDVVLFRAGTTDLIAGFDVATLAFMGGPAELWLKQNGINDTRLWSLLGIVVDNNA